MSTEALEDELAQITEQFSSNLNIESRRSEEETKTIESPPSDDETSDDKEEFSFSSTRFESISADEIFINGQIFPFFDQTLLTSGQNSPENDDVTLCPPVKTILVESPAGHYREFAEKPAGDSPETCEKSNSTGFSNVWRFKEMGQRSNSDGRDAFVFMKRERERREKAPAKGQKGNIRKKEKGKTAAFSAHYVESRERREKDKMRTYLPYKNGFFGIFTSLRGGLTKNVHPY